MYIYVITNKINNKQYIGQSVDYIKRYERHLSAASNGVKKRLYDSIRKYGSENFDISVICECTSKEEMDSLERYYIDKYNTIHPNGYNMTIGGDGGNTLIKWSEQDKIDLYKRQAESRLGQKRTTEQKETMSVAAKVRESKKTPEEKKLISEKMSTTCKERGIRPPDYTMYKKGEKSGFSGNKHSEDTKKKISMARLGKTYEEIMGEEKAKTLKLKKSEYMKTTNNPNYVEFTVDDKLKILDCINKNLSITMSKLELEVNKSYYKIRCFLQDIGIQNFQVFKRIKDDSHKKKILQEGIEYVNRNK